MTVTDDILHLNYTTSLYDFFPIKMYKNNYKKAFKKTPTIKSVKALRLPNLKKKIDIKGTYILLRALKVPKNITVVSNTLNIKILENAIVSNRLSK